MVSEEKEINPASPSSMTVTFKVVRLSFKVALPVGLDKTIPNLSFGYSNRSSSFNAKVTVLSTTPSSKINVPLSAATMSSFI